MVFKYKLIKIKDIFLGFMAFFSKGKLFNYCIENNAGDSFNVDFLKDWKNINAVKYSFGSRVHYLFCGSILARSNSKSLILGAGFISKEQSLVPVEFKKVYGIRGQLSFDALKNRNPGLEVDFFGDPGLLAKEIVKPTKGGHGPIGVIPHFLHYELVIQLLTDETDFRVIDIRESYDRVCHDILKCRCVVSSSLHGLVFSDSMGVPNAWISFGEGVKGGRFKFDDYYSVMSNPKENFMFCRSIEDIKLASQNCWVSENPNYEIMKLTVESVLRPDK